MGYSFTLRQCIRALLKIGFTDASKRGGKHFKYRPPEKFTGKCEGNIRQFITVPKHNFFCQDALVNEIGKLCDEETRQAFLKNL